MAKFGDVKRSRSREKRVGILLPGADAPVAVLLRATSALEDRAARVHAIRESKAAGETQQQRGQPVYDVAEWEYVISVALLDVDSEEADRQSFFGGGLAEVHTLPTDSIAYLFQNPAGLAGRGESLVQGEHATPARRGRRAPARRGR